jgi:hypothetical protein
LTPWLRWLGNASQTRLRYLGDTGPGTYTTLAVRTTSATRRWPPPSLWSFAPADTTEGGVLVELGVVEQRYAAVREVLEVATAVNEVCVP